MYLDKNMIALLQDPEGYTVEGIKHKKTHLRRLVHSVITSRLDYCNTLFMNISNLNVYKLYSKGFNGQPNDFLKLETLVPKQSMERDFC